MAGTGLFWGAAIIAVVVAAELSGNRTAVYAGGAGGLALALMGSWCAGRAAAAEARAGEGCPKAWSWWGFGILSRLVALVALALVYRLFWGASQVVVPVLTMAGVYLAWLFWDVVRLWRRASVSGKEHG